MGGSDDPGPVTRPAQRQLEGVHAEGRRQRLLPVDLRDRLAGDLVHQLGALRAVPAAGAVGGPVEVAGGLLHPGYRQEVQVDAVVAEGLATLVAEKKEAGHHAHGHDARASCAPGGIRPSWAAMRWIVRSLSLSATAVSATLTPLANRRRMDSVRASRSHSLPSCDWASWIR